MSFNSIKGQEGPCQGSDFVLNPAELVGNRQRRSKFLNCPGSGNIERLGRKSIRCVQETEGRLDCNEEARERRESNALQVIFKTVDSLLRPWEIIERVKCGGNDSS